MRSGEVRVVSVAGDGKIDSIYVGDESVVRVAATSDQRFIVTALPSSDLRPTPPGVTRQTSILALDSNRNVVTNLEVVVSRVLEDLPTNAVEIHKRLGSDPNSKIGVAHYRCSPVKCFFVSEDKIELPTQVVRRDDFVTSTNNPGPATGSRP